MHADHLLNAVSFYIAAVTWHHGRVAKLLKDRTRVFNSGSGPVQFSGMDRLMHTPINVFYSMLIRGVLNKELSKDVGIKRA
ncbi:hypothetical protein KSS87_016172 [Heliosperma pusillum]|nr:hypothetical protein KSS87_016172 [Heliosperma pusillum]